MKRNWIGRLLAVVLCAMPFVAAAQDSAETATRNEALAPTAMKAAIWTNKLGYSTGEQMDVYLTLNPMGDTNEYTWFVYRENIGTGERKYLPATKGGPLTEDVIDTTAQAVPMYTSATVTATEQERIWRGSVPAPGLWQWVGELRNEDATQVVKKIYAKFVVSQQPRVELGFDGTDTEITEDTVWTNDTIYRLRHQVFVNPGATLTIQAGTLIQALGQNAVIVVEKGGKIMAEGRRDAPIVMTCDQPVGLRESGCWAGLIVLGNAPMTRGTGLAEGVIPETRPVYGGDDPLDSSGVLRYVRVEFAGVDFNPETQPNAFGFHGIGAGTVIEYIQAHEGEDDGIEFFGGTANCMYCVSSGSKDDSLDWAFGWQGMAQYVFIHQDPQGDNGIEADNDSQGFDRTPRSHPHLYNVTMVGGLFQDENSSSGDGMRIRVGTAITARNVVVMGFGGDALDVRDNSPSLFADGTSSIKNSILTLNGAKVGDAQIKGGVEASVEYMDVDPMLINVRYEANPDPRPMLGSPVRRIGNAATPPGVKSPFDSSAQFVGAFGEENWLEEWTFFGDEFDYDVE